MMKSYSGFGLVVALALSLAGPVLAADGVKIDDLVVAKTTSDAQRETTLKAVRAAIDADRGLSAPA